MKTTAICLQWRDSYGGTGIDSINTSGECDNESGKEKVNDHDRRINKKNGRTH